MKSIILIGVAQLYKRSVDVQSVSDQTLSTKHSLLMLFVFVSYDDEGRKEMFYLTTHSTHFIYGYMASDIWLRTILIVRKETRCRHIGYSF